ncbi:MAG: hypothetical protein AB8F94_18755 [Saprospiraceae bacterium]
MKRLLTLCTMCFVFLQFLSGQEKQKFLFTKGENNISIITTWSVRSAQCAVVEYPDFLVIHEITEIPNVKNAQDSKKEDDDKVNPLLGFIDSIYLRKPIKYILNSHHHRHSLSTITPFLEKGAKLVTSKENLKIYNERGLFGSKTSEGYSESIIQISSDTVLLAETKNPIEVLYLKKSDYGSIPTETFLFFYYPNQKLLAASCMVHLTDFNKKYGYKGLVYNDRLIDANKIIVAKNLKVEKTLQLFRLRFENDIRKPPIFSMSYFQNVLKHSWHRRDLAKHFQNMSYEELTTNKDSLLNYLGENDIYYTVLNQAVYLSIEKKEYQKAVAIAQILIIYEPGKLNEIDTLGEAYYNNGQMEMAQHYDKVIKRSKEKTEGLGLKEWEINQKNRLKNDI